MATIESIVIPAGSITLDQHSNCLRVWEAFSDLRVAIDEDLDDSPERDLCLKALEESFQQALKAASLSS